MKKINKSVEIIPYERIEQRILLIRGQKVMIDSDLAMLYGVTTKRLKEQVRRNIERFPSDFMFELTTNEKVEVVANCDHLKNLKFSPYLPYAFTEHGTLMLANVLNSQRAVQVSLQIVRTFVRLRQLLASNVELARKLEALEKKYDEQFKVVFEVIRQLLIPLDESSTTLRVDRPVGSHRPEKPKRQIGFKVEEPKLKYHYRKKML
jgi:phage regulator Rha-like protein